MILHFRLSICSWGKITVIWTMLGGRASMEHYLRHNKISFFFHVTSIIGVQTNFVVQKCPPGLDGWLRRMMDNQNIHSRNHVNAVHYKKTRQMTSMVLILIILMIQH
jgi:hypothetical protein